MADIAAEAGNVEPEDARESSFGFLVHDVARSLTTAFDCYLKPLGLTRSQWRAIIYVARSPGISQVELADQLSVGRMAVTGVVDKLQTKGYLRRVPDDVDRRLNRIYLTESAEALLPTISEAAEKLFEELLTDVPIEDQQVVLKALDCIKRNAERVIAGFRSP